MNKTEKALEIFNSMAGQSRKEVVAAIAQGLKTTKPNASTYYSKVAKMAEHHIAAPAMTETDDQIRERIRDRFEIMDRMTQGVVDGVIRSMIVFGAPGVGKSYGIEQLMAQQDDMHVDWIKGACTAPGLYHALFNARKGGVVILDDCDTVFDDEQTLNILKGALDTTGTRTISWRKRASWVDQGLHEDDHEEEDDTLPATFTFNGAVIFITNIDFQAKIAKQGKMANHFQALISRSLYLDLTMKTVRDRIIRIDDIFSSVMAPQMGLSKVQAKEIMGFVADHADRMIDLSLRLMVHVVDLFHLGGDWKKMVEITKMRNIL